MAIDRLRGSEAHTVYKLKDGSVVPGVTTICKRIPKPFLMKWSNMLGLEGLDYDNYMQISGEIGTAVHDNIEAFLTKEKMDWSMVRPEHKKYSEFALKKFKDFLDHVDYKVLAVEEPLVSEMGFGGTFDILMEIDGEVWLLDIKTGNRIYPDMGMQLSALRTLLMESKEYPMPTRYGIMRLGRDDEEGWELGEFTSTQLDHWYNRFCHLLDDYWVEQFMEKPAFLRTKGERLENGSRV